MKNLLSFLVVFPLIFQNKANYSTKEFKAGIWSISLSPLYASGKSYFSVEVNAAELWTINIEIHIENDLHKDVTIFKKTFNQYEKTYIEYDNRFTRQKNKLVIYQKNFDNKISKTFEHELNVVPDDVNLIKGENYLSNKVIYFYKDENWHESQELLSFDGFDHLYSPDYYHKIDLSNFVIHVNSQLDKLRYSKAVLLITNRNGAFDNLEHDSIYAHINLKLTEFAEQSFTFELDKQLYVDRHSLTMYSSYQKNTVKTKYLYLPINEKRFEEEYDCHLIVESIGIDDAKLSHQFSLKTQKNIIGDCINSEYCVVRL